MSTEPANAEKHGADPAPTKAAIPAPRDTEPTRTDAGNPAPPDAEPAPTDAADSAQPGSAPAHTDPSRTAPAGPSAGRPHIALARNDAPEPSDPPGTIEAGGARVPTRPTPGSPGTEPNRAIPHDLSDRPGAIETGGARVPTHPTAGSPVARQRRTPRASSKPGAAEFRHTRPRGAARRRAEQLLLFPLLAIPLGLALIGPFLPSPGGDRTQPFDPAAPWPGTDHLGSSVLDGVLDGGWGIVVTAAAATLLAYLAGLPIGLAAAATRHRWLDEILMRPFDLLLALPSLLLMLLLASIAPPTAWMLVLIVALVNLPDIARIVRAAALEVAHRPAVEAMWLQGEGWWRTAIGYIGRSILPTVAADAGVRLVGAFYLVAAASFLGVGAGPEASDWAVMVDVNRGGIFLSPWGVVLPAALLVALSVGLNLLFDRLLSRRDLP